MSTSESDQRIRYAAAERKDAALIVRGFEKSERYAKFVTIGTRFVDFGIRSGCMFFMAIVVAGVVNLIDVVCRLTTLTVGDARINERRGIQTWRLGCSGTTVLQSFKFCV
jgi:hypothetical protein